VRATHLFSAEFDLEILGRLLCDAAAKVQLVDLARFVPHRRLVVHDEATPARRGRRRDAARRANAGRRRRRGGYVERAVSGTGRTAGG